MSQVKSLKGLLVISALVAPLALGGQAWAGSNITVGSMTVNGLKVVNLKCDLQNGGFMAAMVVVSGLAKQKKALQGCAKGKETAVSHWTFGGGKIKKASVSKASSAKVKKCVKKALLRVKAGKLIGTCSAGIIVGK